VNQQNRFVKQAVVVILALIGLTSSPLATEPDKSPTSKAKVYVYPEKLTAKDKLSFGPGEEEKKTIPIKGETTLIYVDLMPDARFAHPTQCILISSDGVKVHKGDWWLILNGKPLFRNGKDFKVGFPIELCGK
jgi:uncharacterized Zn-binding protein involved in type VI secretion